MNETTMTRRSALTTGTLFLGTGLLGTAGTRPEPVAAEPLPAPAHPTLATVVGYPDLEAESTRLHELAIQTLTASVQARRQLDADEFRRGILPNVRDASLSETMRATGISVKYCAQVRRGEQVPHAMYGEAVASCCDPLAGSPHLED